MNAQQIIDKVLEATELDFKQFAMECKIIPNTLSVAISRNTLSGDIVTKIHDRFGVRKEFLRTGKGAIKDEKHTQVQVGAAVAGKQVVGQDLVAVLQDVLAEKSDYRIIPKTVLDGEYRLLPKSEIEQRAKELESRQRELEDIRRERIETIDAKNKLIKRLEDEISELRGTRNPITPQGAK